MSEPATHSPVPAPGDLLAGKYRVLRVIGEGGMGLVLEAEQALSNKRVAIKWLHPSYAAEPNAGERLLREARAAARVRHPNVVDVYDVIEEYGSVMLVMELLEGETLGAALERGDMSIAWFLRLVIGAMRGVAAAHKQNVIHRDIKPENIFLVRHPDRDLPVPKVLDFGISKVVDGTMEDLTRTGDALGTPLYMSCEQLNGVRDLDQRADVYSFGVLLYEGLSGYPPFDADTYSDLIVKIATSDAVPLGTLRPELPVELTAAVHRALEKDRELRTPSLEVFAAEIERLAAESPSGPRAILALSARRSRVQRAASTVIAVPFAPPSLPERRAPRRSAAWIARGAVLLLIAIAAAIAIAARRAPAASAPPVEASTRIAATHAPAQPAASATPAPNVQRAETRAPLAPAPGAQPASAQRVTASAQAPKHGTPRKPANARAATEPPAVDLAPVKSPRLRAGRLKRDEF